MLVCNIIYVTKTLDALLKLVIYLLSNIEMYIEMCMYMVLIQNGKRKTVFDSQTLQFGRTEIAAGSHSLSLHW